MANRVRINAKMHHFEPKSSKNGEGGSANFLKTFWLEWCILQTALPPPQTPPRRLDVRAFGALHVSAHSKILDPPLRPIFPIIHYLYIYGEIADASLLLWQRIHSSCIPSAAHHGPMVAL